MQWGASDGDRLKISPFQQKLIFADNEFTLACCGRASGKTSGVTCRLAYRNVNFGRSAMLIAPTFGLSLVLREHVALAVSEVLDVLDVRLLRCGYHIIVEHGFEPVERVHDERLEVARVCGESVDEL